jgi:hypothetical protein
MQSSVGKPERKDHWEDRYKWKVNIKIDLEKYDWGVWTDSPGSG